jgi:hypothetical protein
LVQANPLANPLAQQNQIMEWKKENK